MSISQNFLKNEKIIVDYLDIINEPILKELKNHFKLGKSINFFNLSINKNIDTNLKNLKFKKIYENNAFEKVFIFFDGLYEHILFYQKPFLYESTAYNLATNNPHNIFETSYFNKEDEIINLIKKRKKFIISTDKSIKYFNSKKPININSLTNYHDKYIDEPLETHKTICDAYNSLFDKIKNISTEYLYNNISNYNNIFIENCENKCSLIDKNKLKNVNSIIYIKLFKNFLNCLDVLESQYNNDHFIAIPYLDTSQKLLSILENNINNKNLFFYLENDGYDLKDLISKSINSNFIFIDEYIKNEVNRRFYKGDIYYGIDNKSLHKNNIIEINF